MREELEHRVERTESRLDLLTTDVDALRRAVRMLVQEASRDGRSIPANVVELLVSHGEQAPLPFAAGATVPNPRQRAGRVRPLTAAERQRKSRYEREIRELETAGHPKRAAAVRSKLDELLSAVVTCHDVTPVTSRTAHSVMSDVTNVTERDVTERDISGLSRASLTDFGALSSERSSGSFSQDGSGLGSLSASPPPSHEIVTGSPRARASSAPPPPAADADELEDPEAPSERPSDASPRHAPPSVAPSSSRAAAPSSGAAHGKRNDFAIWAAVDVCGDVWLELQQQRVSDRWTRAGLPTAKIVELVDAVDRPPFHKRHAKAKDGKHKGARCKLYDGCLYAAAFLEQQGVQRAIALDGELVHPQTELIAEAFRRFANRKRVLWSTWPDEAAKWAEVALAQLGVVPGAAPASPPPSTSSRSSARSPAAPVSFKAPGWGTARA